MKRTAFFILGGVAAAMVLMHREEVEHWVQTTARDLKGRLDPLEHQITGTLSDLARRIDNINDSITNVAKASDRLLGRLASDRPFERLAS